MKKFLILIGLIFIFFSYYLFIFRVIGRPKFIENHLHIENIYLTNVIITICKYSNVGLFLIFFALIYYEFIHDSKKESLFCSKKFKEIFIHMFVIALWVDIQIPVIIISVISALGSHPVGFIYYNSKNITLFLLYSIPFISITIYLIRKFIKKKLPVKLFKEE